MPTIFISHVEEDRDIAFELAAGLEAGGYSTWLYERDGIVLVEGSGRIAKESSCRASRHPGTMPSGGAAAGWSRRPAVAACWSHRPALAACWRAPQRRDSPRRAVHLRSRDEWG